jgi:hypothetical protein
MNRPFGVPALAGRDRLKAGLQTSGGALPFPINQTGQKSVFILSIRG